MSIQKAVWLLTDHYFGGCPLTIILTEEDQSTDYIGVPPPCHVNWKGKQRSEGWINRSMEKWNWAYWQYVGLRYYIMSYSIESEGWICMYLWTGFLI